MGSKRAMLRNGLGHLLDEEAPKHKRFIDLFTGSGSVAGHVAVRNAIPVIAYDLQEYSVAVVGAIVARTRPLDADTLWKTWLEAAEPLVHDVQPPVGPWDSEKSVYAAREWCAAQLMLPITRAYGGHYFSPLQAVWIDALRATIPTAEPQRSVALAALVHAASQCVAAPGHTAQPFQPSTTALPYLREAWNRSVAAKTSESLNRVSAQHALRVGQSCREDANVAAGKLHADDLVFVDPPYSGVHYSRFYHVLETITTGECGEVSGSGRYPSAERRPKSRFSLKTESELAMRELLRSIWHSGATAILTFPDHDCSNGLSGDLVRKIASEFFKVTEIGVASKFSTLGGYSEVDKREKGRAARKSAKELILVLRH
ncbi:DNA adenine methylase [Chelativorans sp. J32]|uniref:DNA adenine methylase n=1 Tax=Chelativorans sp. J32 TaxID=935840 RepID=UPI000486F441